MRHSLERVRFDTIAGAVQAFTEDMLVRWVRACITKTGIPDLVCGGGVFMNVKANMLIAEMPEVRSLHIIPTGSDESLSIGACLHRHFSNARPGPSQHALEHLYFGTHDTPQEETAAVEEARRNLQIAVAT